MVKNSKKLKSKIEIRRKSETIPIDELYVGIFESFKLECSTIAEINYALPKKIEEYFEEIKKELEGTFSKFTKNEKMEYENYINFYKKSREKTEDTFEFKHSKVHRYISRGNHVRLIEGRFKRFVRVNSLILLISEFEYFLTRILDLTFSIQPKALKSKDKKISFDIFLDFEKDDALNNEIDRELDKIMHEDIDFIANTLNKKFKLNLKKRRDWKLFSERFYRRNLLIHNRGKINKKYLIKTGLKTQKRFLTVDEAYLIKSINLLLKYSALIGNYLIKKFHKSERTSLLDRHKIMCAFLPEEHDIEDEVPSIVFVNYKS